VNRFFLIIVCFLSVIDVCAGEKMGVNDGEAKHCSASDVSILKGCFDYISSKRRKGKKSLLSTNDCLQTIDLQLRSKRKLLETRCGDSEDDYPLVRAVGVPHHRCSDILTRIIDIEQGAYVGRRVDQALQYERFIKAVQAAIRQQSVAKIDMLLSVDCGAIAVQGDETILGSVLQYDIPKKTQIRIINLLSNAGAPCRV